MYPRSRSDGKSVDSPRTVRLQCECGEWIEHDALDGVLRCDCGERYAVTITPLR